MREVVKGCCMECVVCTRVESKGTAELPAQSPKILGIFENLGVDLTFGLPRTSEGYIGLIVITDYLSKYPYAVAIKD